MFFVADKDPVVFESLSRLGLHFRDRLNSPTRTCSASAGSRTSRSSSGTRTRRIEPMHHMFTMPREEDLPLLDTRPARGHRPALRPRRQRRRARVGEHQDPPPRSAAEGLLHHRHPARGGRTQVRRDTDRLPLRRSAARRHSAGGGPPDHGPHRPAKYTRGMAFPKTQAARDEMMDAPGPVDEDQLEGAAHRLAPPPRDGERQDRTPHPARLKKQQLKGAAVGGDSGPRPCMLDDADQIRRFGTVHRGR